MEIFDQTAAPGQYEAVVQLLSPQSNFVAASRDITDRTPLSWAAELDHLEIANLLANRTDVDSDSMDKSGPTPLSWAAAQCHGDVVRMLAEESIIGVSVLIEILIGGWSNHSDEFMVTEVVQKAQRAYIYIYRSYR